MSARGQKAESEDKSRTITRRLKPRQSKAQAMAEMTVEGVGHNVVTAAEFSKIFFSEPDLTELMVAQTLANDAVKRGDLKTAEGLLTAQAATLNAIFTNLAFRAYHAKFFAHADRYMRQEMKARLRAFGRDLLAEGRGQRAPGALRALAAPPNPID